MGPKRKRTMDKKTLIRLGIFNLALILTLILWLIFKMH